jgi:periplasmic divalent cation tolerance protein
MPEHPVTRNTLLIFCNTPDADCAAKISRELVERRLAACVNILAPCQSIYRWHGAVEDAQEIPLVIKTTAERYAELEAVLRSLHPYEVPEIIALPIATGLPAYLAWIAEETAAP